ncbi:unnamed protein product [Arctogadus glacialis]
MNQHAAASQAPWCRRESGTQPSPMSQNKSGSGVGGHGLCNNGTHPLKAADVWGASRATGVELAGPASFQMGSHLAFPPHANPVSMERLPPLAQQESIPPQSRHLKSQQMKMRGACHIKSIPGSERDPSVTFRV